MNAALADRKTLLVAALVVLGVAYRAVYVIDLEGKIDGDNAVVGLMARHILEGRHYAFFWGQSYMGSLEAYLVAAAAAVFGLNDLVLRGVPLVFGVAYMASFHALGRRLGGDLLGVAALALAALCPPLLASWSSAPRGGYPEMLFLGQVSLLLALRGTRREGQGLGSWLGFGFVAGLAFWMHPEALVFVLAGAAALVLHDRRVLFGAKPWLAALVFLAGSLPVWVHQLTHRFDTFSLVSEGPTGASAGVALHNLVVWHLPKLAGVRDLVGEQAMTLGPLGVAVGLVIAGAVAIQIVGRLWDLLELLRGRREGPGAEVLLVILVVILALYLPSRYGTWNTQRYLLPLYTVLIPLTAVAWLALARRSRTAAASVAALTLVVFARGAWSLHQEFRAPQRHSSHLPAVVEFMEARGIRHGYADHDEALVNTYRSEERIVLLDRAIRRYPVGELADWKPTAVLTRGSGDDVGRVLDALRCTFRVERFGRHTLLYEVTPALPDGAPLPRDGWRASASVNDGEAALAIDGDPRTRWASSEPQRPGLSFEIDLGRGETVSGVRIHAEPFATDVARGLRIAGRGEGEAWTNLAELSDVRGGFTIESATLRLAPRAMLEARFEPTTVRRVRLEQTGSDARFDWSITELELLTNPPAAPSS